MCNLVGVSGNGASISEQMLQARHMGDARYMEVKTTGMKTK